MGLRGDAIVGDRCQRGITRRSPKNTLFQILSVNGVRVFTQTKVVAACEPLIIATLGYSER